MDRIQSYSIHQVKGGHGKDKAPELERRSRCSRVTLLQDVDETQHSPEGQDGQKVSGDGDTPLQSEAALVGPEQRSQETTLELHCIPVLLQRPRAQLPVRLGDIVSIQIILLGSILKNWFDPGPSRSVQGGHGPLCVNLAVFVVNLGSPGEQNAAEA